MTEFNVKHKFNGMEGIANVDKNFISVQYEDGTAQIYHQRNEFYKLHIKLIEGEHCAEIVNLKMYRWCKERGLKYRFAK